MNKEGKYNIERATGQIKSIIDLKMNNSKQIIFHHRMPSSSKNKISQTHPILIESGDLKYKYYIIHNGVIRNSDEIKEIQEKDFGYTYSTEKKVGKDYYGKDEIMYNDSETLGYEIARFIESDSKKIKAIGSAAFIMTQVDKKTDKVIKIFYGRNEGNPLHLSGDPKKNIFLSSEGPGDNIKEDSLYSFTPDDFKVRKQKMIIPTKEKEKETADMSLQSDKYSSYFETNELERSEEIREANQGALDDDNDYRIIDDGDDDESALMIIEKIEKAKDELDIASEILSGDASGEEVYMFDIKDTLKRITGNLTEAFRIAQDRTVDKLIKEDKALEENDKLLSNQLSAKTN